MPPVIGSTEMAFTDVLELTTIGDPGVGKTSIIRRFVFNNFISGLDRESDGYYDQLTGVYFYLTALLHA